MLCPPCKGTGREWGTLYSDCQLCKGEGVLPDTRMETPLCHYCNGSGREHGVLFSYCSKCGGWGRRERQPVVTDPTHQAIAGSSLHAASLESLRAELGVREFEPNQIIRVLQIQSGKPRSAHLEVARLLQSLQDDVRICDPYFGMGSLLRLDELKEAKSIRFLTQKLENKEQVLMPKAVAEFVRERPRFEFRKHAGNDLHDRFVVTEKELILLGHGLKDIGNKESFVVKLDRTYAGDVIDNICAAFDSKWKQAQPVA